MNKSTVSLKGRIIDSLKNCEANGYKLSEIDDLPAELIDYGGFEESYDEIEKVLSEIFAGETNDPKPNFDHHGPCKYDTKWNERKDK